MRPSEKNTLYNIHQFNVCHSPCWPLLLQYWYVWFTKIQRYPECFSISAPYLKVIFSLKWSKRRQFEVKIRGGVDGSKGSLSFLTSSQMGTKFFSNGHQMVAHFSSNRTLSLVLPPIFSTLNLCLKSWQIMFLYCVDLPRYFALGLFSPKILAQGPSHSLQRCSPKRYMLKFMTTVMLKRFSLSPMLQMQKSFEQSLLMKIYLFWQIIVTTCSKIKDISYSSI